MRKITIARLGAGLFAAALALWLSSPAAAAEELELQNKLPITADEFNEDCNDERMAPRKDNEDGWHFVAAGGSFESISVTFQMGGDGPMKHFSGTPSDPGDFTFFTSGPHTNHAYLFTPAGWTLIAANAKVTGANFTLSHTCAGTPDDKGDNGDDENGDDENGDDENGDDENGDDENGDDENGDDENGEDDDKNGEDDDKKELPKTGVPVGLMFGAGGALVLAGIGLMLVRRNRISTGEA